MLVSSVISLVNYHYVIKQQTSIPLQFWQPKLQNPASLQFLWGPEGRMHLSSLLASGGCPGIPRPAAASLQPLSASILTSPSPLSIYAISLCFFLRMTLVLTLRAHTDHPRWSGFLRILTLVTSTETPFLNKTTLTGSGGYNMNIYLWGPPFGPL